RNAVRSEGSQQLIPPSSLAADVSRVMTSFFRRISTEDDKELLAECFVDTRESESAARRLARISEDLVGKIRALESVDGVELTELIQRAIDAQRQDFVVIVGTKGAGKSTFIDRFFRLILSDQQVSQCVIACPDLRRADGDI